MRRARRHLILGVGVAALALGVAALAHAQTGTPIGTRRPGTEALSQRELGANLYAANCSTCHGIDARGVPGSRPQLGVGKVLGRGPALRGVGAGTIDFYLRAGYMPLNEPTQEPERSKPVFNDREIRALITYITSLNPKPAYPPIPRPRPRQGSLSQGQSLFTEHCAGCHQVVTQGGVVIGARVPPLKRDGPVAVAEAVRTGPYLMPKFPESQISAAQLNSIIRYVEYAHQPVNRGGWPIGNIGPVTEGLVTFFFGVLVFIGACLLVSRRFKRA
jgi:ubiquinol-cytochrome c reductase cytochrome c subunit